MLQCFCSELINGIIILEPSSNWQGTGRNILQATLHQWSGGISRSSMNDPHPTRSSEISKSFATPQINVVYKQCLKNQWLCLLPGWICNVFCHMLVPLYSVISRLNTSSRTIQYNILHSSIILFAVPVVLTGEAASLEKMDRRRFVSGPFFSLAFFCHSSVHMPIINKKTDKSIF